MNVMVLNFLASEVPAGLCFDVAIGANLASIIQFTYNGIRLGVPIVLVLIGMIEFGKAIPKQSEDEIKKARNIFLKQTMVSIVVFLMLSLVILFSSIVGNGDKEDCIKCLLASKNCEIKK